MIGQKKGWKMYNHFKKITLEDFDLQGLLYS
jgi:hypothetical protein